MATELFPSHRGFPFHVCSFHRFDVSLVLDGPAHLEEDRLSNWVFICPVAPAASICPVTNPSVVVHMVFQMPFGR